jgi:hypothetical protein
MWTQNDPMGNKIGGRRGYFAGGGGGGEIMFVKTTLPYN